MQHIWVPYGTQQNVCPLLESQEAEKAKKTRRFKGEMTLALVPKRNLD